MSPGHVSGRLLLAMLVTGAAFGNVNGEPRAAPPSPPKPDAAIRLVVERQGHALREATVRESEIRASLGTDIFYDVDAFIATGLKKLRLDSAVDCQGTEPKRVCMVTRVGDASNTEAYRWRLYCDGLLQKHGINQINWRGISKISLVYEPIARTP